MTRLEKRLFHHFDRSEIGKARQRADSVRISCPRVGTVRATVTDEHGGEQEVHLELSAGRRGGMTLESRCSSALGRRGTPCAALAAVLLEIDRRGLFSTIQSHTPIALECVADPSADDEQDEPETEATGDADDAWEDGADARHPTTRRGAAGQPRGALAAEAVVARPAGGRTRLPNWAADLEERRRLVEPAVRTRSFSLVDGRRAAGSLVFVLDISASTDARSVVLVPSRMQIDVTGNSTGRPRPATIDLARLHELEPDEQRCVAQLLGTAPIGSGLTGIPVSPADPAGEAGRSSVSRITVNPKAADFHLAMLCEQGRLVLQPEPRRAPDVVLPLAWDGGRAWEFALVLDPDDPNPLTAGTSDDEDRPSPKPARATLRGMLARGSQRKSLEEPRAILRAGLVIFSDRIARLDAGEAGGWLEQFERRGDIELASSHVDGLIERLAGFANLPRVHLPAWTGWRIESGPPRPKLVLEDTPAVIEEEDADPAPSGRRRRGGATRVNLAGRIWFDYGGILVAADDPSGGAADVTSRVLVRRDRAAEREALSELPRHGVTAARTADAIDDAEPAMHHVEVSRSRLDASVSQLAARGWAVEVSGRRYRPVGSVAWNVTSGIDWFELSGSIDFGGASVEVPTLLAALARGDRSVELPDGSIGVLPENWAGQLEPLLELAERHDGRLRFSRMQVALLDALLAGQPTARVDEAFERMRAELTSGERPEPEEEPEGFTGTLRHYQREGLGWLAFLERMGIGGCLADDMGLGKTIQVLAMLVRRQQVLRDSGLAHRPSLVVVPKSLVFNWLDEARKFAPQLRVVNHTGNTREEASSNLAEHDIVLTTYGTLRRDVVRHREIEFDYVVLDEAQSIKNAASQAAKACRLLRARHRLAVTGTPVENHIGELWSIFEFLNPGQLGTASRLKRFLAAGRGGTSSEVISRAVRPYLLRRTKAQVLSDLPEKTEQTIFCELGGEQRKAYDELREHYRQELAGKITRMGIGRSRIAVLEALLRLRQTACHQGLVDPARIDEPSAKLDLLSEQLEEVLDEGHKVLVFSQFTSFLAILRRRLDARQLPYEYLDGKTTDRQSRVVRFQEDPDCRLFLVSLKAGGQGLNLTAADYIYILDPWWNPAVEAQAIDRAHRIGQTRRVFAYRLIAKDTVEEKIVSLQDRKRDLADSIVRADESMLSSLTPEDVELLFS
jgi:superfamily II DNA or RNA helicase